jgi:3-deoxy-D-manno-octulosonate 8-phosphate phosphatase (KDO 8-P phosphatase)
MKKTKNKEITPKVLILDVDGVFTDGKYYYTEEGKIMKKFGPDDNDALSLLQGKLEIIAISGDKRGFPITKKRIADDMKLRLEQVSTFERYEWIKDRYNPEEVIYMGDGIFDALVFDKVGYSIAPANAFFKTKEQANYVTKARGSEGAVAEAVVHILEKFFNIMFNIHQLNLRKSGSWEKNE